MKPRKRFSKGQMAVVMTLALATLLGAMALGTDVAILYFNWVQLQKAADAGALAGATKLDAVSGDSTNAQLASQYADGYACLNGINASANDSATVCPSPVNNPSYVDQILFTNVDPTNTQVSLGVERQVPYYFARVMGLTTGKVAAQATAKVEPAGTCRVFPALLNCPSSSCSVNDLSFGSPVNFGIKFDNVCQTSTSPTGCTQTADNPGNWGWLNVGQGQGGSQLKTAIEGGYSSSVTIGQTLNTVTGGKDGPVNQAWTDLLAEHNSVTNNLDPNSVCAGSNPNNIPNGDPLMVTVPVGNMGTCAGNCSVTVTGFAEIYLTGLSAVGGASNAVISGCFVKEVAPSCSPSDTASTLGPLQAILIQ